MAKSSPSLEEQLENKILAETPEALTMRVEQIVQENNCSYLDALIEITTDMDYDTKTFKKLITPGLYEKLEREAEDLSLLKTKSNRLDI